MRSVGYIFSSKDGNLSEVCVVGWRVVLVRDLCLLQMLCKLNASATCKSCMWFEGCTMYCWIRRFPLRNLLNFITGFFFFLTSLDCKVQVQSSNGMVMLARVQRQYPALLILRHYTGNSTPHHSSSQNWHRIHGWLCAGKIYEQQGHHFIFLMILVRINVLNYSWNLCALSYIFIL